jgi:hypothetical protein
MRDTTDRRLMRVLANEALYLSVQQIAERAHLRPHTVKRLLCELRRPSPSRQPGAAPMAPRLEHRRAHGTDLYRLTDRDPCRRVQVS